MNREIKFRFWDDVQEKMIYGLANAMSEWDSYRSYEVQDILNDKTTMQYIGLKDKNGKEIYEGDIVDIGYREGEFFAVVLFDTISTEYGDVAGFGLCDIRHYGTKLENQFLGSSGLEEIKKVVGNIHENSELLNKKNK